MPCSSIDDGNFPKACVSDLARCPSWTGRAEKTGELDHALRLGMHPSFSKQQHAIAPEQHCVVRVAGKLRAGFNSRSGRDSAAMPADSREVPPGTPAKRSNHVHEFRPPAISATGNPPPISFQCVRSGLIL